MGELSIVVVGGGPWGIRLSGGGNEPLVVSRLRKNSHTAEAGLCEGDNILAINGHSCSEVSHSDAVQLLETTGDQLSLLIQRGGVTNLASVSKPLQISTESLVVRPPSQQPSPRSNNLTAFPSRSRSKSPIPIATQNAPENNIDKYLQLYSNTLNPNPKPGIWAPSKEALTRKIPSPAPMSPEIYYDAMDYEAIKENHNPAPLMRTPSPAPPAPAPVSVRNSVASFNVKSAPTAQKPLQSWQPKAVPNFVPQPVQQVQQIQQIQPIQPVQPVFYKPSPSPEPGSLNFHIPNENDPIDISKVLRPSTADYSSDEYTCVSPTGRTSKKKIYSDSAFYDDPNHKYPTIEEQIKMARKVAMSLIAPANKAARGHEMFIKRAKKADKWVAGKEVGDLEPEERYYHPNPYVATVPADKPWIAPAAPKALDGGNNFNTVPRGFNSGYLKVAYAPQTQTQYSTPSPQPTYAPEPVAQYTPMAPPPPPVVPMAPAPPPVKQHRIKSPEVASHFWGARNEAEEERPNSMNASQLENYKLFGKKSMHNSLPPQVAFNISADLKNMKGKGGNMFAKRKERADKYIVDDGNAARPSTPNQAVMARIAMQAGGSNMTSPTPTPSVSETTSTGRNTPNDYVPNPVNRLAGMVGKPSMSPWEAALKNEGNVEHAFNHLSAKSGMQNGFSSSVPPSLTNYNNPPSKTQWTPSVPSSTINNSKMKGWSPGAGISNSKGFQPMNVAGSHNGFSDL